MGDTAFWRKSSYSGGVDQDCVEVAANWHKSSYSGPNGSDCVEVAADWHKSSHSAPDNANCVEVAESPHQVKIRDTKHRDAGHLSLPAAEWSAFLADLKGDRL